jgi:hypothetical protein
MKFRQENPMRRCLVILALLAAACSSDPPIDRIMSDPRAYVDNTVTIEGKVTDVFSLLVVKYYTVSDGTGSIAVVTDRTLPAVGQKVKVRGTVTEVFSLGRTRLIVLMEDDALRPGKQAGI